MNIIAARRLHSRLLISKTQYMTYQEHLKGDSTPDQIHKNVENIWGDCSLVCSQSHVLFSSFQAGNTFVKRGLHSNL